MKGDASAERVFDKGEFITKVEGLADGGCIVRLKFVTNKRMLYSSRNLVKPRRY